MNKNLASSLTSKIEQERQMMQEHQESLEQFQQTTKNVLNSAERNLQGLQQNAASTTQSVINDLKGTIHDLNSIKNESSTIAKAISEEVRTVQTALSQQKQNLQRLTEVCEDMSDKSNEVAKMTKMKKNLVTTNIILSALAATFFISSICFGYVSKSKYNDIQAMQNKVDYLKSQGGSMITTTCGGKLCVELDPKYQDMNYALDSGTRPLAIVREIR